jgi:hypothetical protein
MVGRVILLPVVGVLLAACDTTASRGTGVDLPPVRGLTASLEDETQTLDGRRRWSTYWRLCWTPYPNASGYELQTVTSEGRSPRLKVQTDRCYRLQVAAGFGEGARGRDLQLQVQSSQLAFRVRAITSDGRRSAWSDTAPAGRTFTAAGPGTAGRQRSSA